MSVQSINGSARGNSHVEPLISRDPSKVNEQKVNDIFNAGLEVHDLSKKTDKLSFRKWKIGLQVLLAASAAYVAVKTGVAGYIALVSALSAGVAVAAAHDVHYYTEAKEVQNDVKEKVFNVARTKALTDKMETLETVDEYLRKERGGIVPGSGRPVPSAHDWSTLSV